MDTIENVNLNQLNDLKPYSVNVPSIHFHPDEHDRLLDYCTTGNNGTIVDYGDIVAFTWSPKPNISYILPSLQCHSWLPLIRKMNGTKKDIKKYFEYLIYPECNKQGNIHFHGIIKIYDRVKWFRKILPLFKYNGFVFIKSGDISHQWHKYIAKDEPYMREILEDELPYANSKELYVWHLKQLQFDDTETDPLNSK